MMKTLFRRVPLALGLLTLTSAVALAAGSQQQKKDPHSTAQLVKQAAQELQQAAKSGHPFEHAYVDPATGKITLTPAHYGITGLFAAYFPGGQPVTAASLQEALPLLKAAAVARHEHVRLDIPPGGTSSVSALPMPGKNWEVGSVFSSYGPRYAGSDVISGYGIAHVAGYDMSASVTRGLPGLTPKQSAGGSYLGEAVAINRPTPWGIFSVDTSRSRYLTGGPYKPLDLTGTVTQVRAGDRYPILAGHVWLRGGLEWASDRERLGALAWTTTQRNVSAYLGATGNYAWHGIAVSARASVWQGLVGSDSASPGSPNLMGTWSDHYTVERIRLAAARNVGPVRLSGIFGYQHGSAGTPQVMQAYIGGRHRGSSFFTGAFAGPTGYWWSAEIAKAKAIRFQLNGVRLAVDPYVGVNGGSVSPIVGPALRIAAVTGGVSFALSRHVIGSAGWSHTIAEPAGIHRGNLFNFNINVSF